MNATLRAAFDEQAGHCERLGSAFMARLLRLLAQEWPENSKLAAALAQWQGDIGPLGASLPLRVAGGLHAIHLSAVDSELSRVYPPADVGDSDFGTAILGALARHDDFLCDWIRQAPQTNEVRRSACMIVCANLLNARFGLPLAVSELGASGGLNLMFNHFALQAAGTSFDPSSPALTLCPDWQGSVPPASPPEIVERRGVDLNPLDPHNVDDALRLLAYLWPDQPDRLSRTRAAIAVQNAQVDRGDAIDWLGTRLTARPGQAHMIYHTIAWQYFPAEVQRRGEAMIEAAGARATEDAPLAWMRMEADDDNQGAGLSLRLWPGNHSIELARVDFHGRWVNWTGPTELP